MFLPCRVSDRTTPPNSVNPSASSSSLYGSKPASDEMSLPWNSSFRRRSKSTRKAGKFDSPIGYAMAGPLKLL